MRIVNRPLHSTSWSEVKRRGPIENKQSRRLRPLHKAGATWWLESLMTSSLDKLQKRIKKDHRAWINQGGEL